MFTCLALGVLVIAGNYLELLPGGEVSNNFLLIGLVLLIIGFVLSTFFNYVRVVPSQLSERQACNFTQVSPQSGENLPRDQSATRTMSSRQCRGGSGSSCAAVIVTSAPQTMQRKCRSTGLMSSGSGSAGGATWNFRSIDAPIT